MGKRVVVGVDGSAESRRALGWAADEARAHGGTLDVVAAWSVPYESGMAWGYGIAGAPDVEAVEAAATRELTDVVRETLGADPGLEVRELVREGHPATVLIDASREADLLVVGSRGHGGFARMLLGSTSTAVVQHATVPVVVVPHADR